MQIIITATNGWISPFASSKSAFQLPPGVYEVDLPTGNWGMWSEGVPWQTGFVGRWGVVILHPTSASFSSANFGGDAGPGETFGAAFGLGLTVLMTYAGIKFVKKLFGI